MPLFNNQNTQRRPIGSSLGSLYARFRGLNPIGMLNSFGQNFRTAAGIPAGTPLWTKEGGIQLGNLPSTELQPDLSGLSAAQKAAFESGQAGSGLVPMKEVAVPGNGMSLGSLANIGMGLYQGGTALKGLYDNMNSDTDLRSLKDDINLELASNPMYDTYLDAADEKLIRQVKNGSLTNNWGGAMSGALQGIPKAALTAALGYLTGGVGGAAIGGIGSLVNSGISGYGRENEQASAKLQGLYDKLRRAGEDYRTMKRPAGIRQAGLSTQYFNQLY